MESACSLQAPEIPHTPFCARLSRLSQDTGIYYLALGPKPPVMCTVQNWYLEIDLCVCCIPVGYGLGHGVKRWWEKNHRDASFKKDNKHCGLRRGRCGGGERDRRPVATPPIYISS